MNLHLVRHYLREQRRRRLGARANPTVGEQMTVNTAKFEESTEIIVDSEVEVAAAGWTLNYSSVNRIGNLVVLHVEATNAVSAAGHVLTLQSDFAPGDTVTDPTGTFTLTAGGVLTFTGSTAAGAKRICQLAFQAGSVSP